MTKSAFPTTKEYEDYAAAHQHLSKRTLTNYRQAYNKMMERLDKSMTESNQKDIIEVASDMNHNPN